MAAVSNAGGMRVLGPHAGQNTNSNDPEEIGERLRKEIQKTKQLTNKPFGVNHNLVEDHPISNQIIKVCVEENVKVLSVVGSPNEQGIKKTKELGFTIIF
ncbi:nitronate monooxygenase [Priestia megaterium]